MDRDDLLGALDGVAADAVIHQATAITGVPLFHRSLHATDDLREQGTTNLLEAARAIGSGRFITQSFFLGYGYRDHGPDPMTSKLVELTRRRLAPALRGAGTVPPIHLHDAASATVAALDRGRPGQAYNIVDYHPVDFGDYIKAMAETAGAHRRVPCPVGCSGLCPTCTGSWSALASASPTPTPSTNWAGLPPTPASAKDSPRSSRAHDSRGPPPGGDINSRDR